MALRVSSKPDQLEGQLRRAIAGERRASTRVQRATTALRKWAAFRRRVESRIGAAEVRRIVNRLSVEKR